MGLTRWVAKTWTRLNLDARDGMFLAGLVLFAVGWRGVYAPLASLSVGAVLLFVALRR